MSRKSTLTNGINSKNIIARPLEFMPSSKKNNTDSADSNDEDHEISCDPSIVKMEIEEEMVISSPKPVELTDVSQSYLSPSSPDSESSQPLSQDSIPPSGSKKNIISASSIYEVQSGSSIPHKQQYIYLDEQQLEMLQQGILPPCILSSGSSNTHSNPSTNLKASNTSIASPEPLEMNSLETCMQSEIQDSVIETSSEPEDENAANIVGSDTEDEEHNSHAPSPATECPLPNLLSETGKYGFSIILDDKEDTIKTPTWLMSKITKKLYTNMNKAIPFRVSLKRKYPRKVFHLRAMAVFKYPMFLRQNVVRCPNHLNPNDASNVEFPNTNHVIRADHPRAIYEASPSGRLSVVVPLEFPENRCEAVPVLLKFMCHNSCVGGISRRPLAVLLSLETNGEEVGRYTVDVRVCACPSRDVKTEEKYVLAKGLHKRMGELYYEERRGRKRTSKEMFEDENLYFLQVRGQKLFKFLQEMKTLYLKTHPEYASQFPDFPLQNIRPDFNSLEEGESSENGISENGPPAPLPVKSSPKTPSKKINTASTPSTQMATTTTSTSKLSSSTTSASDTQRPLIFIYAKSGEKLTPMLLQPNDNQNSPKACGGQLPKPLVIKQERDSPPPERSKGKIKAEMSHKHYAVYKPKNDQQNKDTKTLVRANSASSKSTQPDSLGMIKSNSFSGSSKVLTSEMISAKPLSHLQVQAMPHKGKKALVALLPKVEPKRNTCEFLKNALQKDELSLSSDISKDEEEKMRIAAEVLASNLGTNSAVK